VAHRRPRCGRPGWASSPSLASVHKYLRSCDLSKELALGTKPAERQSRDFIQLVCVQSLMPPVPEKHLTWLAPSVEGKELCIGLASVVQWRAAEPPAEAKTDTAVVLCKAR